jgi:methyl-accepting chemotaxis protein
MKWFNNLKIGTKIIAGFLLVALMAGAIGAVGIYGITTIAELDENMYKTMTDPLSDMVIIADSFQRLRGNVKDILLAVSASEIAEYEDRIALRFTEFDAALDKYEDTLFTEEGARLVAETKTLRAEYETTVKAIVSLHRSGNSIAAIELMKGRGNDIRTGIESNYRRLAEIKNVAAETTAAGNHATASATQMTMIIILAFGMIFSVLVGIVIANSISRPLRKGLAMIQEMSKGHLNNRLHLDSRDEVGQMANAMDAFADDLQHKMIGNLNKIAVGDVSVNMTAVDDQDEITPAMIKTSQAIRRLVTDANALVEAAVAGRLDTRADASVHQGDFAKIVDGVNRTLDAVIKPVQEASTVLNAMSQGNLQMRVNGNYQGDHAAIKIALNDTLDALSDYVREIASVLTDMANSNMDVAITGEYRGDFAAIKTALNMIVESFNDLLTEMNSSAEQVAAGAKQVSDGSQALSQGATEQASSLEQLTASITEIAAQTKQNAINAGEANELALKAKDNAIGGNSQMQGMVKAMSEINESSTSISKIIKVIDEIAFQTNILALNAAVEAARAGQHGKGFAVVAEEVRNLAARSANAAKETTDLIEGSIHKVNAGTKIADDTAKALDQIVTDVSRATDLVGSIAVASNEQATAIAQVNQGVEQVSQVVQANSATSEQSAATSEELSGQAELLKTMISRFNLRKLHTTARFAALRDQGSDFAAEDLRRKPASTPSVSLDPRKKLKINLNDMEFGKY